ncbi:hypothetical protein J3R30DRAFT_3695696 [Lentinula aciculospora]|uniref:Uncharacterized protein n=1 Tax=Lentinula aciculospora TaxID=153920 RepID=A0A9W9AQA5_9AGAR|nr:hypothetical protein J3R30DRAFT_3695696 [Lentinula aciculospora]
MSKCLDCGGSVVWSEVAISNICISCGTLTDPSQRVLANNDDLLDSQYLNPSAPNTLKRLRGGSSWALAGQSREARVRNNTLTMHEFIKSLTQTLSVNGLSPRVCNLFDQAMKTTQFKWGTKAKTVAGACLSIALRESGRPDFLKDIAFLIEQSDINLKRTLSSVLSALNITLTSSSPAQFLTTLQSHLSSILQSPVESCGLKISVLSELKSLSIHSAVETARLFIDILSRSASEPNIYQLSPAAFACAIFIMSLEAEKRGSLSHLADISASFAGSCAVAKVTVMNRYQALHEEVSKWIKEVEWLDSYQKSSQRAKASKRQLCARGLKDALNWKHGRWKNRVEEHGKPDIHSQLTDIDSELESETDSYPSYTNKNEDRQPSRKKKKVHSSIRNGAHFLLNPLDTSVSASSSNVATSTSYHPQGASSSRNRITVNPFMTSSYLLSTLTLVPETRLPSRLQQLSVARGGANADVIFDDELLAEGEWETMLRTPEEMRILEQRWRDDGILDAIENVNSTALQKHETRRRKEKETQARTESLDIDTAQHPVSKRINLEALSSFMLNSGDEFDLDSSEKLGLEFLEDDLGDKGADDEIIILNEGNAFHPAPEMGTGYEITIDDWRPASPGLDNSFDDYYL